MLDLVVADEGDDVLFGELGTGLLELFDQGVAVHVDVVAGHWSPLEWWLVTEIYKIRKH